MLNVASDVMEEVEVDHTNGQISPTLSVRECGFCVPFVLSWRTERRPMTWSPNTDLKTVVVGLTGVWAPDLPLRIQALFQLS